jgi:hypothetical protein
MCYLGGEHSNLSPRLKLLRSRSPSKTISNATPKHQLPTSTTQHLSQVSRPNGSDPFSELKSLPMHQVYHLPPLNSKERRLLLDSKRAHTAPSPVTLTRVSSASTWFKISDQSGVVEPERQNSESEGELAPEFAACLNTNNHPASVSPVQSSGTPPPSFQPQLARKPAFSAGAVSPRLLRTPPSRNKSLATSLSAPSLVRIPSPLTSFVPVGGNQAGDKKDNRREGKATTEIP